MPHYSGDDDYIFAWNGVVLPVIEEFKPKLVVVSAGFDGLRGENLTTLRLSELFFEYAGATLSDYPLAAIFEGGYSVGLERGLPAFIKGYLSGKAENAGELTVRPSYEALKVVERVREIQSGWWKL